MGNLRETGFDFDAVWNSRRAGQLRGSIRRGECFCPLANAAYSSMLCDPLSLQYLGGAEIDYSESLQGAQFVIRNPNATTTCGCGSSFST